MIRFLPDTLRDALWRPLSMAAPDAGVYVEIMAPDLRYAALLLLTVAALLTIWRRRHAARLTLLLVALVWVSFVPWLLSSGNGRYFIPLLLAAGPACIALIYWLPWTLPMRLALAVLLVGLQGIAVADADPRGWWGLVPWRDHYFELELPAALRTQPAAYVSISSISYSLVAPQFDARSRWMALGSISADRERSQDARRAQAFLAGAAATRLPIRLWAPTVPNHVDSAGQPDTHLRSEINRLLNPHQLALEPGARCALVRSDSMAWNLLEDPAMKTTLWTVGFWSCPLRYPYLAPPTPAPAPDLSAARQRADAVFGKLESLCPRFFPPGQAVTTKLDEAFMRSYSDSDIKLYVLADGRVFFRYWRALSANSVGTIDQVLQPGFVFECNEVRGRSGLPWERKL